MPERLDFADYKRNMELSLDGTPDPVGYSLQNLTAKDMLPKPFARPSAGRSTLRRRSRTACLIHPENLASIRVAQKCGYREFSTGNLQSTANDGVCSLVSAPQIPASVNVLRSASAAAAAESSGDMRRTASLNGSARTGPAKPMRFSDCRRRRFRIDDPGCRR